MSIRKENNQSFFKEGRTTLHPFTLLFFLFFLKDPQDPQDPADPADPTACFLFLIGTHPTVVCLFFFVKNVPSMFFFNFSIIC